MTIGFDAKGLQHSYDLYINHLMKETASVMSRKYIE